MSRIVGRLFLSVMMISMLALPMFAFAAPSTEHSNGTVEIESHAWGNYHWARTSNPFTLKLGDNVSENWDAYLKQSSVEWNESTVLQTNIVPGGTKSKPCKPTAGLVEICNDRYGKNGWLGIAQIWLSGNHITKGIVKMNDTYFNTSTYNTEAWRQMVMCQEIGHTFGLDHQDETFNNENLDTCMDYTNNPSSNQSPNQHDYDQLELIYSHLDSSTTVASSTETLDNDDFNSPKAWGKLIKKSADGHKALYLLDLGKGHYIITHVFWAN